MTKFKLSILTLLTVFVTSSIFISCSNDENTHDEEKNNYSINTSKLTDNKLIEKFNFKANSASMKFLGINNKSKFSNNIFDFENATINSTDLAQENFLVARTKDYNENNPTSFIYSSLIDENDEIYKPMIVKSIITGDLSKIIEYLDLESGIVTVTIFENGKFSNSYNYVVDDTFYTSKNNGCGQAVADCIADAYTNDGWGSVGLWIASAVIPEVPVAVAVYCIGSSGSNC